MAKISTRPDSEVPYESIPGFAPEGVLHGFFGRCGGISGGVYRGLNCGIGSRDAAFDIKENRAAVAEIFDIEERCILSPYQVHGATCLKVKQVHEGRPEADAQVTDVPGLALSVLTADCAPILFYGLGKGGPVVGAAHAGWKGALGGVLDSTVAAMGEYGVAAGEIRACIGPCISKRSYEVGAEFMENFLKENDANEKFFMNAQKEGHFLFDLGGYCALRLYKCGVTQVSITGQDTYANEQDYYSFRRATHRGEADYGRQISLIMIRP